MVFQISICGFVRNVADLLDLLIVLAGRALTPNLAENELATQLSTSSPLVYQDKQQQVETGQDGYAQHARRSATRPQERAQAAHRQSFNFVVSRHRHENRLPRSVKNDRDPKWIYILHELTVIKHGRGM